MKTDFVEKGQVYAPQSLEYILLTPLIYNFSNNILWKLIFKVCKYVCHFTYDLDVMW